MAATGLCIAAQDWCWQQNQCPVCALSPRPGAEHRGCQDLLLVLMSDLLPANRPVLAQAPFLPHAPSLQAMSPPQQATLRRVSPGMQDPLQPPVWSPGLTRAKPVPLR